MKCSDKNELININLEEFLPINSKIKSKRSIESTTKTLPYSSCTHTRHSITLLGLNGNDQLAQSKKDSKNHEQPVMGSSRWNPTPEQLLALEEMYRRGTRTPTAEQIQQIAAQLRRFGKIEGKNVFYWFQNHKARERQKRRREMEANSKSTRHDHPAARSLEKKDSEGLRRTGHELEQKKNHMVPVLNCSSDQHVEGPFSMHRAATAESTTWSCFEQSDVHQHKNGSCVEKNSTWNDNNSYTSSSAIHLMNTTTLRFMNLQWQSSWFNPNNINVEEEVETLNLFPLSNNSGSQEETKVPIRAINTKLSPNQYIEFLPLKS